MIHAGHLACLDTFSLVTYKARVNQPQCQLSTTKQVGIRVLMKDILKKTPAASMQVNTVKVVPARIFYWCVLGMSASSDYPVTRPVFSNPVINSESDYSHLNEARILCRQVT